MNMRQEKKRRVFRKYYFQEKSTLIVAFFFITLCIVIFLQQIPFFSIKNVFSPEKSVALIVWELATGKYNFLILAVILRFYFSFKSRIDKTIKSFEQNEEEGKDDGNFIIRMSDGNTMPRNESWEKIKEVFERAFDNRKHVFFVGKSGSGKSLLLRTYLSEYEKWEKGKKDSKVNIFSTSDKNADIVYRPIGGNKTDLLTILDRYKRSNIRQLIIFDQFEKLILPRYKDAFSCITKFLSDNSGNTAISVVFVCTNEEYINVLKKLEKKPEDYENYFPEIELNDKDSMLDRIKGDCGIKEGNERYKFFVNELADPKNVSMIEINAAKKYFQIEKEREVYINVLSDKAGKGKTEKDTMELIFKYHLERMLARLETPELAMITLYALCCANGLLNRRDFQNITFAPEETVTTILESLKSQEIIELTHDEDKDSPYILSHEYLIEKLTSCCNENLSAQIMVNIEFYCNKINKSMESGGEPTAEVSVYYKHTINEDKSSNAIRTFMKVLCTMIVGVCVWYEITNFNTRSFFMNFAPFNFVIKY
ncbi:MAG: ATP-binding protein, partial [Treponema sp.]|nr:ATP-binding protein [Treponema sp.]